MWQIRRLDADEVERVGAVLGLGYVDAGVPPRRVQGTIRIRTGTIQVDDTLLTWEKSLDGRAEQAS
jgi:hypothetical protein